MEHFWNISENFRNKFQKISVNFWGEKNKNNFFSFFSWNIPEHFGTNSRRKKNSTTYQRKKKYFFVGTFLWLVEPFFLSEEKFLNTIVASTLCLLHSFIDLSTHTPLGAQITILTGILSLTVSL